jgi:hypothetical protein
VQADLCQLPEIGGPFDVVIANMVFLDILDWTSAMREHGEYRIREYFAEYEIPQPYAPNFHRPLSAYLNEVARLGCSLVEVAEPAVDPAVTAAAGPGAEAYAHLPNYLIVAARRAPGAIG